MPNTFVYALSHASQQTQKGCERRENSVSGRMSAVRLGDKKTTDGVSVCELYCIGATGKLLNNALTHNYTVDNLSQTLHNNG